MLEYRKQRSNWKFFPKAAVKQGRNVSLYWIKIPNCHLWLWNHCKAFCEKGSVSRLMTLPPHISQPAQTMRGTELEKPGQCLRGSKLAKNVKSRGPRLQLRPVPRSRKCFRSTGHLAHRQTFQRSGHREIKRSTLCLAVIQLQLRNPV